MPALLHGSLAFFPLPELLRFLVESRRSGSLVLRFGGREEEVRLADGAFVGARAAQTDSERVARLVRETGLAPESAERVEELLAATGGLLTGTALQKKIVSPAQFSAFAAAAVREALLAALHEEGGEFEIRELDSRAPADPLDLTLASILEAAEQRRKESTRITPATVFRTAGELDLERITLTAAELKLLLKVDSKRNVRELAAGKDVDATIAVLEKLLEMKLIERGEERESPAVAPRTDPMPALRLGSDEGAGAIPARATLTGRPPGGFTAACLTVHDADKTSFPLFDDEYTLGRERSNDISISDPSISGRHARIHRTPEGYELEDLGSRNGTFVNAERIERRVLRNQDSVRLGKVQMVYTVAENAPSTPQTSPGEDQGS